MNVAVGLPTHGMAFRAHERALRDLFRAHPEWQPVEIDGCPNLDIARAVIAEAALEAGADVLLFIDADIVFEVKAAEEIVLAAASRRAIVGGLYLSKRRGGRPLVEPYETESALACYKSGDVVPVKSVTMGFTAIHRRVLDGTPARRLLVKSHDQPRHVRAWFATTDPEWNEMESDDFAFCRRVRTAWPGGLSIWVDTRPRLEHIGLEHFTLEDQIAQKFRAETLLIPFK